MSENFRDILSKANYKEGFKKYKEFIKKNDIKQMKYIQTEIIKVLKDTNSEPYTYLYATKMLQDCMKLGNADFIKLVQDQQIGALYELQKIVSLRKGEKYDNYGKTIFGENSNEEQKKVGKSIAFLMIECIYMWQIWFNIDTETGQISNFTRVYNHLKNLGIQFPPKGQMTYFKEEEKEKFQGKQKPAPAQQQQQAKAQPQQSTAKPKENIQEEEEEEGDDLLTKLEDFENLKEEVRRHLNEGIKDKTNKIQEYFIEFKQFFDNYQDPIDKKYISAFKTDADVCNKVLNLIKQLSQNKVPVNQFLKELSPMVQELEDEIFVNNEVDVQQFEEEISKLKDDLQKRDQALQSSQLDFKNVSNKFNILKEEKQELEDELISIKNDIDTYKKKISILEKEKESTKSNSSQQQDQKDTYELQAAKLDIQNLKEDIENLNQANQQKIKEIKSLKEDLDSKTQEQEQYTQLVEQKSQEYKKNLNDRNQEIVALNQQVKQLRSDMENTQKEDGHVQKEINVLRAKVRELEEENEDYEELRNKYDQDLEQQKQQFQFELEKEKNNHLQALEKSNLNYADTYIQLENAQQEIQEKQREIQNLELQIEQMKKNKPAKDINSEMTNVYKQQLEEKQLQNQDVNKKLSKLQLQNSELELQLKESKQEIQDLKTKLSNLQKENLELNDDFMKEQASLRVATRRLDQLEKELGQEGGNQPVIEEKANNYNQGETFSVEARPKNQQQKLQGKQNANLDANSETEILKQRLMQMEEKQHKLEQEIEFSKKEKDHQIQQVMIQQSALTANQSNAFNVQSQVISNSQFYRLGNHQQQQAQSLQQRLPTQPFSSQSQFFSPQKMERPSSTGLTNAQPIKLSQYLSRSPQNISRNYPYQSQQQFYQTSVSMYKPNIHAAPEFIQKLITFDREKFNFIGFLDRKSIIRFQKSCYKNKFPLFTKDNEIVVGLISENCASSNSNQIQKDKVLFNIFFTNKGVRDILNLTFKMDDINLPSQAVSTARLQKEQQKKMEIFLDFKGDQKITWGDLTYQVGNQTVRERIPLPNTMYRFLEQIETKPGLFLEKWEQCSANVLKTIESQIEEQVIESVSLFQTKLNLINISQNPMAQTFTGGQTFNIHQKNQNSNNLALGGLYYLRKTNTKILFKVEGRDKNVVFSAAHIPTNEEEARYHAFVVENLLQTMLMIFTKQLLQGNMYQY